MIFESLKSFRLFSLESHQDLHSHKELLLSYHFLFLLLLQRFEQYFTSFQTFSHFFLHVKSLWQITQFFTGICLPRSNIIRSPFFAALFNASLRAILDITEE